MLTLMYVAAWAFACQVKYVKVAMRTCRVQVLNGAPYVLISAQRNPAMGVFQLGQPSPQRRSNSAQNAAQHVVDDVPNISMVP